MAKIPLGRPAKTTSSVQRDFSEGKQGQPRKTPVPLQIRLSTDEDESNRLKDVYAARMGRQGFLDLLNASDEQWEGIRLILAPFKVSG